MVSTADQRMPKIRRERLPDRLLVHLLTGVREKKISCEQLVLLARWLDAEPEVPAGKWFKNFPALRFAVKVSSLRLFCSQVRRQTGMKLPRSGFIGFPSHCHATGCCRLAGIIKHKPEFYLAADDVKCKFV